MRTILVVDDDQTTQLLMRRVLAPLNANVIGAMSFSEALLRATEFIPDLILMDIRLPGAQGNGWTAAKIIRDDPKLSHIPIIILTAGTMSSSKEEELRYEAYIQKPFHVHDVLDCIREFLI